MAALLGFACVNLFLENSRLEGVNSVLLKDLENVKEKNERLTGDYATAKNNLNACNVSLSLQNEAIKGAAVEIDDTPSKEAERIKKIYVKDKSCEAELAAYKELFRDLDFAFLSVCFDIYGLRGQTSNKRAAHSLSRKIRARKVQCRDARKT